MLIEKIAKAHLAGDPTDIEPSILPLILHEGREGMLIDRRYRRDKNDS
jgi:hypothetical protein